MNSNKDRAGCINDVRQRLIKWAAHQEALTAQYGALKALTGADCESPLMGAVFDIWTAYNEAVSEAVGDKNDWLGWYEYECHMGARPSVVVLADGRSISVRTLRQLATVICT